MERLVRRLGLQNGALSSLPRVPARCLSTTSAGSSSGGGDGRNRRLYRILQRQCMDLMEAFPKLSDPSSETMFLIQPPLNPTQHGSFRTLPVKTVSQEDAVKNLLVFFRDWNEDNGEEDAQDWFDTIQFNNNESSELPSSDLPLDHDFTDEPTLWATASSIQNAIRYAFRNIKSSDPDDPAQNKRMTKFAIRTMSMLMEQAEMRRLSSISFEKDVRVVATSKHIGSSHGGPMRGGAKHRFNYRIRIENLSDQESVQLLGRLWHIEDLGLPRKQGTDEENPIIVDAPKTGAGKYSANIQYCSHMQSLYHTLTPSLASPPK